MIKKNLLSLLIFFILCACNKDSLKNLSGEYKPDTIMELVGNTVMYTRNGPLNDINLISEFVNRRSIVPNSIHFFSETIPDQYAPLFTLNFLNGGLVTLSKYNGFYIVTNNARISNTSNNEINITYVDSDFVRYSGNPCILLGNLVTAFNQISRCTSTDCWFLPFLKLKKENGQYYQNLITYMVANTNTTAGFSDCYTLTYLNWDNFDPAVYQQLGQRDTIVVQRKRIKYIKQ